MAALILGCCHASNALYVVWFKCLFAFVNVEAENTVKLSIRDAFFSHQVGDSAGTNPQIVGNALFISPR